MQPGAADAAPQHLPCQAVADPNRKRARVGPLPLRSTVTPRRQLERVSQALGGRLRNKDAPGSPCDHRLARFTVSPHKSYENLRRPMIPATTEPEARPIRSTIGLPDGQRVPRTDRWTSSAMQAAAAAWSGRGVGAPLAAIYASPAVLIFSRPN